MIEEMKKQKKVRRSDEEMKRREEYRKRGEDVYSRLSHTHTHTYTNTKALLGI